MIETLESYFIKWKYTSFLLTALIIVLSLLIRLSHLEIIEFKADEASNLFLATRVLFGHPFPLGGIGTSIGSINPPLFVYFLMLLTFFTRNPILLSGFIAIVNSLLLGFFFVFLKKCVGLPTALITGLFMATSPWMILFSRKIWPPDLAIPLVIILLYFALKIGVKAHQKYWAYIITILLFLVQLDLAYLVFSIIFFLCIVVAKPKLSLKHATYGFILGILPFIPYIILQIQKGCPDCTVYFSNHAALTSHFSLRQFLTPLQLLHQGGFFSIIGTDIALFASLHKLIYLGKAIFYLEYLLVPLGIILFWKKFPQLRFVVYTPVITICAYFFLRLANHTHYHIVIVPFFFLFIAIALTSVLKSRNTLIKATAFLIILIIIIESISYSYAILSFISQKRTLTGDYGSSFVVTHQIAEKRLKKLSSSNAYEEIEISSYLSPGVFHGTDPLATVAYNLDEIGKNSPNLTNQLQKSPEDFRILYQLIAYYTKNKVTKERISSLREKQREYPAFSPIYNEVYGLYLQQSLKSVTNDPTFGIAFEFPQHWKPTIQKTDTSVMNDNYVFSIKKTEDAHVDIKTLTGSPKNKIMSEREIVILGSQYLMVTCTTTDNKWCGSAINPLHIGKYYFYITYQFSDITYPSMKSEKTILQLRVMDEIAKSVYIIY